MGKAASTSGGPAVEVAGVWQEGSGQPPGPADWPTPAAEPEGSGMIPGRAGKQVERFCKNATARRRRVSKA